MDSRIKRIFPDYFDRFELPSGARDEYIKVYRACRTGKCDRGSFLNSFEENGFKPNPLIPEDDPGQYSLSTYEKPKEVKRFASISSEVKPPYKIAVGTTNPVHGPTQRTKERIKTKSSHVDWWLYKDAKPQECFDIIDDFEEYLEQYSLQNDKGDTYGKIC